MPPTAGAEAKQGVVWPGVQKLAVLVPPFTVNRPEFGLRK